MSCSSLQIVEVEGRQHLTTRVHTDASRGSEGCPAPNIATSDPHRANVLGSWYNPLTPFCQIGIVLQEQGGEREKGFPYVSVLTAYFPPPHAYPSRLVILLGAKHLEFVSKHCSKKRERRENETDLRLCEYRTPCSGLPLSVQTSLQ